MGPVVAAREPITVTMAAKWADLNNYKVGETVFADTAGFEGGLEETTTYRWRVQTRPNADGSLTNGSWTNYTDHAEEVSIALAEAGDIRFQCQARDTGVDPVEQVNSFANWQTVEALPPLVVGNPVATGEPYVGYTLSCSEPSITGGSGNTQIDYFWVDESNAMVWENTYMSNTCKVIDYDLGKTMKCLVTVTDKVTGENTTVHSNELGPINRPTLPEYDVYVDGELHEDPSAEIGVAINGSVVLEVRPQAVAHPPLDLVYSWRIRSGTGRLSGDESSNGIIYLAPDAAPAGALVQCTAASSDANDNAYAAEATILVAE